jgi:hypothetical protein
MGNQFQNGRGSKTFLSFGGCILNCADQSNVVLFQAAGRTRLHKAAAAANENGAGTSNCVEEKFHPPFNV